MNLGGHRTALQDLSSKLYPCHYKTVFRTAEGDLPTALHRGDFIAVSLCEKGVRETEQQVNQVYDESKNKTFPTPPDHG